ncbi:DUF2147 domain-containing protein [Pseudoxanthomonas suwonensis]|uniref:Signal peptide protein n=1 Tax=Pseudoxanthomonas suwonensis TaxID=314722 RepID=A0A0E3ULR1_9GAMM|nr:DUF2147 domain-containing protein [Pseudoxanthomonas suwonensis]AKC85691.1 signal peptide protein [Pseudoxanthomonas suwonensis]
MRSTGSKSFLAALLLPALLLGGAAAAGSAMAADSAVGRWKTVDSDTGKPKSIVEITQSADGTLSGHIVELLDPSKPNPVCDKCSDDRKNKPITGMEIIRGMKPQGGGKYAGGTILKPDEGKVYKSKIELVEGGKKLEVSGCVAFICKSQTWLRQ